MSSKKSTEDLQCPQCDYIGKTARGVKSHRAQIHKDKAYGDNKDIKGIGKRRGKGVKGKKGEIKAHGGILTPQEELFCQYYAGDKEFFGNGQQAYIEAFDITVGNGENDVKYGALRTRVHSILTRTNILTRINEIFEGSGLNDAFVDKQLLKLITQDADFSSKTKAISEYNKIRQRITQKFDVSHKFKDLQEMSDEDLLKEEEKLTSFFTKKVKKK